MQNKGVVRFFLIALTLSCLYVCLMYLPTGKVERDARNYANQEVAKNPQLAWREAYAAYLDGISDKPVFEIPFIKKYTYVDLKKSQLALGLDLKGGMNVLLQVNLRDFLTGMSGRSVDPGFTTALNKADELQKTQQADYIALFAQAWREAGQGRSMASIFARNEALKGKVNFDSPDADVVRTLREEANNTVNETYKRIKQRIDKLGVVQPNVSLDASRDLILVELPGIENPERARKMLQSQAKLEFWDTYRTTDNGIFQALGNADSKLKVFYGDTIRVDSGAVNSGPLFKDLVINSSGQGASIGQADKSNLKRIKADLERPEIRSLFPNDLMWAWSQKPNDDVTDKTNDGKYQLFAIKKFRGQEDARLDGAVVTSASEQPDPTSGEVTVSLNMNNEGAKIWSEMTKMAYEGGRREIAIVLDSAVVSAPSVQNQISGGSSSITGNFTVDEAKDLSNILEVGKLPVGIKIVQESQVGPSLGADNINRSLLTMLLSVGLLCAFMMAYYNRGGIVSVIALLVNLFFILGTLASMGTVLTLPGIAGIVLTLATAVDAQVVIYERIREELRNGLSMTKAIATGFTRALSAILDANVTILLTAGVLIYFGLGPIKGFGTVLLIGVVSSMFTAILVGRLVTEWWMNRGGEMNYSRPWSESWLVGFHYDWIGKRKYAYMFSAAIMLIGLVSFFARGFELGVDFKGGQSFNVQFDKPVEIEQLRSPLTEAFGGNPIIKAVNTENTYNITTSYLINEQGEDVMNRVIEKLHEGLTKAGISSKLEDFKRTDASGTHIASSSQVGPTVADDIRSSSFKASFAALSLIFLFLLIRFRRWQFSLGAVLALFHDVLITLTFFTLLHGLVPFSLEIDQAIIACILTVIGYSVNDTVIVYDRIREFMGTFAGRKKEEVFNMAINTTLSRTLITSGTVFAVVLLLFLFGGSAIKGFAFGMLAGVLFGTYSSIFVASALVVDFTREDIITGGKTVEAPKATAAAPADVKKKAVVK
jgi:SecD/SecF fusion protein